MTMGWKLWFLVIFLLDAPLSRYQILPSPTALCLCCNVGIYVKLLYAISDKDGMLDIISILWWHQPSKNAQVGDVVVVKEYNLIPGKWPLARITEVHTRQDGLVWIATIKTVNGKYKRPITKLALLLPCKNWTRIIPSVCYPLITNF